MAFHNISIPSQPTPAKAPEPGPSGSDPKPTPASGPTSVPSTPSGAPAPAPAADTADADDLDFGFDDNSDNDADTDDGTGGDDEDGAPAEVIPLGPPEGATKEQAAEWRAQHGIPETAENYKPPAIEGINWDSDALSGIAEVARQHHIPQPAFEAALQAYAEQLAETQANLKRQDKERLAEVRSQITPGERTAIDAASRTMSRDLRTALKQARLPDGRLLLHDGEFLQLLANLSRENATSRVGIAQTDAAREAEIRQVMRTDYEAYMRRGLDKELSAILRRKGAR